jgi:hypothetical protein
MAATLDIVIVTYNTRVDTLLCLASVFAAPPRHLKTVFVVDNASTDGSVDAIRAEWPAARVLALPTNVGFGAGNNVALRQSRSDLVLLLNSDAEVAAGTIDTLVDRLEATGAVAAGPTLVDGDGRPEVSFGRMLNPWGEIVQLFRGRMARSHASWARARVGRLLATERDADWVSGACLLVRRQAAEAVGFFDERFFLYEEDVDLCASLRAAGGRIVFTPRATVIHHGGRSGAPRSGHYDRSHVQFYEKHAPLWTPFLKAWLRLRGHRVR